MISTAAVVPHPPLLVTELAGTAAAETEALRAACRHAARHLAAVSTRWIAVGAAPRGSRHGPHTLGTFAGFGADVRVALGGVDPTAPPDRDLPLPMLVAGWLRAEIGADAIDVEGHVLPADTSPATARRWGAELASDGPAALLVLGDGAATHTARAPGAFDDRAARYDAGVAEALDEGDAEALAALDPALSDALVVGGRVPWQALAGALPVPSRATLHHFSAPFGVAYHVATWDR